MSRPDDNREHRQPAKPESTELSRREWLLRLGEAAVLLGIAGGGTAAIPFERETSSSLAALPPGLYDPSADHLTHALSSVGPYYSIPPGSTTDYVQPPSGPFQPQFFSPPEFETLLRVVESMLGAGSESPAQAVAEWIDLRMASAPAVRKGARLLSSDHRALAVSYYGAEAVANLESHDPDQTCRAGLRWLERESQNRYQSSFAHLPETRRIELLKSISDERSERAVENDGTRFFVLLKAEIIRGYYTSKAGLEELDFKGNGFYPASPGCSTDTAKS